MKKQLNIYKYHKTKLIISFALFVLAIIFLFPLILSTLKTISATGVTPDRSIGYGLEQLEEIRQIYGMAGAKIYLFTRFSYDLIWMTIYTFFFINLLAFLLEGLQAKWLIAIKVLPFIAMISDILENTFCSIYFFYAPTAIGFMAVIVSRIKWFSLLLLFITIVLLSIYKIYQKMKA